MLVKWNNRRCIVCLLEKDLSEEHIIPQSLGGILTCKFLCRHCNSLFGKGFEAKARLAPEIRKAVTDVDLVSADFKEKLERGACYVSEFGDHTAIHKLGKDGRFGTTKLTDGSLIASDEDAPTLIASIMRKEGANDSKVDIALALWESALASDEVELGAGVKVRKWINHPANPAYTEPELSRIVPLKIAYEFAALIVGTAIYGSEFQHIRDVLLQQDEDLAKSIVTYNWADVPKPFHGIAFEGNNPTAQFQVRLFGLLAYTVRFPKIAINNPPIIYTHLLNTNEDCVRHMNQSD